MLLCYLQRWGDIVFGEKEADNRIAQYETTCCVLKEELLDKISEALRVDFQNIYTEVFGCVREFMRAYCWLDRESLGYIRLFQLVRNLGMAGTSNDTAMQYNDNDARTV